MLRKALRGAVFAVALLTLPGLAVAYETGLLEQLTNPASSTSAGIAAKIQSVAIGADRKPVVTLKLTDEAGVPVGLSGITISYVIAKLQVDADTGLSQYVNYITRTANGAPYKFQGQTKQPALASAVQPTGDSGGTATETGPGIVQYKFGTALPEGYDAAATHVVGLYARTAGNVKVANDTFEFVPNGSPVTVQRQVVKTESCNRCHDPLALHGGSRRSTDLCILCHTPQNTDPETGNTVDFKVMVHKIHRGANLPSVAQDKKPYLIVGFGQNVFDFGEVVWPQDVRNCQTCHTGAQGENWKTKPNRAACGSCHDKVDFATGANHPGGVQTSDANCATCHTPTGPEFGASVAGAHTLPTRSTQVQGVKFQIVSVSDTGPEQKPTVVFNIKDNAGNPIAPADMNSLSLMFAGPTTDYVMRQQEVATGATPTGDGNYSYTFDAQIPDYAGGTFAMGIEGYKNRTVQGVAAPVRDAGFNEVFYFGVTDPVPQPRKLIVDRNGCNQCHEDIGNPAGMSIHGGIRRNPQYCIMCHNTTRTDEEGRPQEFMPPESVHFKRMIHKIHTGEEQKQPYIIYRIMSGQQRIYDFSKILFPGDRRNCEKCHVPGAQLLDFMQWGAQPTIISQAGQVVKSIPPITSACTSCHDSVLAEAHATVMTTDEGVETCKVCHAEGRDFAVSKVHRR